MKLVLFAWCPFTSAYVDAAVASGATPDLVVTGATAPADLAEACSKAGVPLARCTDVNANGFVERIEKIGADLLIVAGCAQVLRPRVLSAFAAGALNVHPSLLPDYRGRSPLFWTILRGEARGGVTVHRVTREIDAGPILAQREIAIPDRATSSSLAATLAREGASLAMDAVRAARAGDLGPGREQGSGSHFPALRPEHGLVDFTRTTEEVDRLVRACTGEIPAFAFVKTMRVVVLGGAPGDGDALAPGVVRTIDDEGIAIGTGRGAYVAKSFLFLDRVYDARALAAIIGISPGDRFSNNPAFE